MSGENKNRSVRSWWADLVDGSVRVNGDWSIDAEVVLGDVSTKLNISPRSILRKMDTTIRVINPKK